MEKIYKGAEFMEYPKEKRIYNSSVEAIPIEWIKKFIDNDILSETVKILLNAWYWEKENEQSNI